MRPLSMLVGALAVLLPATASAQTRTAQFAVRASVVADCQVTAEDMDFKTYSADAAATASTTVTVRCTPGSAVTVTFDGGSSGNPQARTMTGPAKLGYQIFRDAALTDPINTGGSAFQLTSEENTGENVIYTIHGQVPAGQIVPAGNYVDTVLVTVQF